MNATRGRMAVALVALAAVTCLFSAASAGAATPDKIRISEIHSDSDGAGPDANYVELQMLADGQAGLNGDYLRTYVSGAPYSTTLLTGNVSVAKTQRTVLIADGTVNGVVPDYQDNMLSVPTNTSSTVCLTGPLPTDGIDCVGIGYGGPMPSPSPFGNVVAYPNGQPVGSTLQRTEARGCNSTLDASDDTNDSKADFTFGKASPRTNAVTPTERTCVPCNGQLSTVTGTNGNDRLVGTAGKDVIVGLGGKDKIKGLGGNDVICGGSGNDAVNGGTGNDSISGGAGKDTLSGGAGKDKLVGQGGKDKCIGGASKDKAKSCETKRGI